MKDFNELLSKTIDKVSSNRNLYGRSEVAVRDQLINPILTFLGWDTSDPGLVIPNARTEDNNIPDYTLIKNAVTQAYVEAKKITLNLKSRTILLTKNTKTNKNSNNYYSFSFHINNNIIMIIKLVK